MKQIFVTILFKGTRYAFLTIAQKRENGKFFISEQQLSDMLDKIGVQRGQTFSVG